MSEMSRGAKALILLALVSCAVLLTVPFLGMQLLSWHAVRSDSLASRIFWELRVPRVLLAYFVGAALALGGVIFQALFRNVLATPFTLGVSSGAACGVAIYIQTGAAWLVLGMGGHVAAAFAGALFTIVLVYALAHATRLGQSISLLLAGVILNFFFSSLILFLQFLGDFDELFRMTRWMIGSLETVGFGGALLVAPFSLGMLIVVFGASRGLDLVSTGEELALTRGVSVKRLQLVLYAAASCGIAAVVAVCGVISFVGIMVPCVCRLVLGPRHRILVPAAFMAGGVFVVLCDLAARTVVAPVELPVGVVTALIGAPFFLWMLTMSRRVGLFVPDIS